MSSDQTLTGQCLCGAVTVSITPEKKQVGACHCSQCRAWNTGPMFAIDCGQNIKIEGQAFVKHYRSSEWAQRGFCSECGSSLYYHLLQQDSYMVSGGLFKALPEFVMHQEIFVEEQPHFYHFGETTTRLTGQELFALFGGE